ncbi:MAG TPA: DUF4389 domain-containing protein [Woeseiaceae bacterium]|nr:DUF4389 domain-containing protein [Woeseiaceae bacterium]
MNEEQPPRDHVPGDEPEPGDSGGRPDFEEHIKSRSTWLRLLFMLILAFLYGVSRIVVCAVIVLQFFWVLFTGETNQRLKELGESLATYTWQLIRYLTFNTESRPFPFDEDWPSAGKADADGTSAK